MKYRFGLVLIILLLVACATPQASPTLPSTLAPTTAPQVVSTPTSAIVQPTPRLTSPTSALSAPTARERIILRDMPGVGRNPYEMAMLGDKVYVINATTNNVAVIQNDRVVKFIPVGKRPADIAVDPAQSRIFVANASDKTISQIVNDQVALTTSIGEEPQSLLFFENRLFVGLGSKGSVLVLDPGTLKTQSTIALPNAFTVIRLAGDAVHHRLYAAIYEKISVIDSTNLRLVTTFDAKGNYYTLAANPANDSILTAIYESTSNTQSLTTIDPISGSMRNRVKIGGDPRGIAITSDGARAFVANSYSNTVSIINLRDASQVAIAPVGIRPNGVVLDEKANRLYVSNTNSDSVDAIDTQTNQVVATIPLGMNFFALAANETKNRVYVASASTDSVFVIEGARVVKEIAVGRHPVDLSRDAQNNRLFVANQADNTLSIIDEATFAVRATPFVTNNLTTVAVDNARGRIFAGGAILDANTLSPIGQLKLSGATLGSVISPDWIRLNSNINRLYAIASNGVPGSNGRLSPYSIDGGTLQQRGMLSFNGNASELAIDPETNRVFVAGTHPLALTNELGVYDANDNRVLSMSLNARTAGIAYNPQTRHLFLSQITSNARASDPAPVPADNSILVLDANSWGHVAQLNVTAPGKMTRLGNFIYVANRDDGSVTLIEDANAPTPPSPTPTFTSTPYPTIPTFTRTPVPIVRNTSPLPNHMFVLLNIGKWE